MLKMLKKVLKKVDSRQAGRRVPAGFDDNQAVDNVRLPDHLVMIMMIMMTLMMTLAGRTR